MLQWISLFGLRREQPKARRSKETVKPRLEELVQRILPSASAAPSPQLTEAAMQMATTMLEQRVQLIVALEQNLVSIFDTYTQRVAQDVASAVQQWKQFLGIAPPAGSGSGSGSGAITTTNNGANKPPVPIRPGAGTGTGSGAITSHENPSQSQLKPLTSSGSGSGSGSGLPTITEYNSSGSVVPEESGSCGSSYDTIGVMLSQASKLTVSVNYATQDGSATAGTDYTSESGTVTFQPGQTVQYIQIPILDDGNDESGGNQSFQVVFSGPKNATLANDYVLVTITEGPQQNATDTLRWSPCPDSQDLASDPTNWYDVTQKFQLQKGAPGPGSSTPVQFDAYTSDTPYSNAPIIWDKSFTVASASLTWYTGQETLNPGVNVELLGTGGVALAMDGNSDLKLDFADHGQLYQIDNNATITNMDVTGYSDDVIDITGGTTTIAGGNFTENLGVSLTVESGATLSDKGQCTLNLTASDQVITVNGEMDLFSGGRTLIASAANSGNYINVAGGILRYEGSGGVTDTIQVPVLNNGTFSVDSATGQANGATLIVQNAVPQTNNVSVYMANEGAYVQLAEAATLEADNGYTQANGELLTMDNTAVTLTAGVKGAGTVNIAGGQVLIDNKPGTFGELDMDAQTVNFAGQLVVAIDPNASGTNDKLFVSGTTNLQAGATLKVLVGINGPPPAGNTWVIIKDVGGNITGNFAMPINTVPDTPNLTAQVNPKNLKEYILKS
jgi:hypothetical protein